MSSQTIRLPSGSLHSGEFLVGSPRKVASMLQTNDNSKKAFILTLSNYIQGINQIKLSLVQGFIHSD